jgi:magnesium transporter
MVQGLSNRSLSNLSFLQKLLKTILIALVNAAILCAAVFLLTWLLGDPLKLAATVSTAIFAVVLLASVMGTLTPWLLDRIGINPALASGPFITTANDLLGLAVYFGVAWLTLH